MQLSVCQQRVTWKTGSSVNRAGPVALFLGRYIEHPRPAGDLHFAGFAVRHAGFTAVGDDLGVGASVRNKVGLVRQSRLDEVVFRQLEVRIDNVIEVQQIGWLQAGAGLSS